MGILGDIWNAGKSAVGSVGSAAGGAADAVFGSSTDPGLLGLSKSKEPTRPIDPNAFVNPNSGQDQADLQAMKDQAAQRQAPQAAPVTVGQFSTSGGAQAAPYKGTPATERAGVSNLGPASLTGGTNINQGADNQMRTEQQKLIGQLQDEAAGHGAAQDLNRRTFETTNDRSLKNAMAMAASRRGAVQPSLTSVLDAGAGDRATNAGTLSSNNLQAEIDAQNQLNGVISGVRSQDIGLETSQAGLTDANSARNQDANNSFALQKFGANNTANLSNAAAYNQNNQFNANNNLNNNQFNATQSQQNQQFNATQENAQKQLQATISQATSLADLDAKLKQQGANDDMVKYAETQYLQQQENDRQAKEDYENLATSQNLGADAMDQKAYEAARAARQAAVGGAADVVGQMSGGSGDGKSSDERAKKNARSLQIAKMKKKDDFPLGGRY